MNESELSAALTTGEIELKGRVMPASNVTFFGEVVLEEFRLRCVYKPIAGERPLWDFPDGSLAGREVAAHVISSALAWDVVPLTVFRSGPVGPGMVQLWREPDPHQHPVDMVVPDSLPPGYLHVLDAVDADDEPVSLVHEDSAALRRMAVFDAVINNADRKGGHILAMPGGHRYGVDHGVCFHVEDKLRTVLWGWADQPLHRDDEQALQALADGLARPTGELRTALAVWLSPTEIAATSDRCATMLSTKCMPVPSGRWPAIPWPAF